jgi:hypothetical protein
MSLMSESAWAGLGQERGRLVTDSASAPVKQMSLTREEIVILCLCCRVY